MYLARAAAAAVCTDLARKLEAAILNFRQSFACFSAWGIERLNAYDHFGFWNLESGQAQTLQLKRLLSYV